MGNKIKRVVLQIGSKDMPSEVRRSNDAGDAQGTKNSEKTRRISMDKIQKGEEERKAIEREDKVFKDEEVCREQVKNLTYNTIDSAIGKISELKDLIDNTILQKPDIKNMRAFRHKDGRILLGSIEHVTEAFNKSGHHIAKADLESLEVGNEKHDIKRISINEELITILKERGFKADIAKHGTSGELEKVGTLHAKWNNEKSEMDVTFEKYRTNQSDNANGASSKENEQRPIDVVLGSQRTDNPKPLQNDSLEVVEPVITINAPSDSETFYDAPNHLAGIDNSETTEVTKPEKANPSDQEEDNKLP